MILRSITLASLLCAAASAQATSVSWNTWSSTGEGSIPTSNGPIHVAFAGDAFNVVNGFPSYLPASTWSDGSLVGSPPTSANGILQLWGGTMGAQTITFSSAVEDPVLAIWSLGSAQTVASFNFLDATPVPVCGGPSAEYGGYAITVVGSTVMGLEGNGTVEFKGTFTSITWTNSSYENWYGFNVGVRGVAPVWSDLGGGTTGIAGSPTLSMSGPLTPLSVLTLDLVDGAPSVFAILFTSLTSTPVAFLGGTLHAFPYLELVIVGTDPAGEIHGGTLFPPVPSGIELWFQVGMLDASVPIYGASLSNAVKGTVP